MKVRIISVGIERRMGALKGKDHFESCAGISSGLNPNLPAVVANNFLNNCESEPRPGVLTKGHEGLEDIFPDRIGNSPAIICH